MQLTDKTATIIIQKPISGNYIYGVPTYPENTFSFVKIIHRRNNSK